MTCVLAMGASKSVIFNHSLNAVNLATWVFVMAAGLFYVDTKTWSEHQGFLPYGWSGVSSNPSTEPALKNLKSLQYIKTCAQKYAAKALLLNKKLQNIS